MAGFKVSSSHWELATVAQMQTHYSVTLGNTDLNLARLQLTDGQTVKTSVARESARRASTCY
jgi:hypothetical protein